VDTVLENSGISKPWEHRIRVDLDGTPRAAQAARTAVAGCLRADLVEEHCVELAVLGTSEVVTNAMLHGRPPCTLSLLTGGGQFRVEVIDASPLQPSTPGARGLQEGGRGLLILAAVSTRWGCDVGIGHKTVWFEGSAHLG